LADHFQYLSGRSRRSRNFSSCSALEMCRKNLTIVVPSRTSMRSKSLIESKRERHSSSGARSFTRTTSTSS